jgi:hypothetical protein
MEDIIQKEKNITFKNMHKSLIKNDFEESVYDDFKPMVKNTRRDIHTVKSNRLIIQRRSLIK